MWDFVTGWTCMALYDSKGGWGIWATIYSPSGQCSVAVSYRRSCNLATHDLVRWRLSLFPSLFWSVTWKKGKRAIEIQTQWSFLYSFRICQSGIAKRIQRRGEVAQESLHVNHQCCDLKAAIAGWFDEWRKKFKVHQGSRPRQSIQRKIPSR